MLQNIIIDNDAPSPIYKQIVDSIYTAIDNGLLRKGDVLPSVNSIAAEFSLARGSVFTAYNELKAAGIIEAWPGKGYYIKNTTTKRQYNILLLLDSFAPYKEIIYNSFISNIKGNANVDLYFHYNNIQTFEYTIKQQLIYYNTFVIIPPIHSKTEEILKTIPKIQLYIMDMGYKEFGKVYPSVCQNFEKDIFNILTHYSNELAKYNKLFLVMKPNHVAKGIMIGFIKFCKKNAIAHEIISETVNEEVKPGSLFIFTNDNDLVELIHTVTAKKLKLGKEIGIISYNETPLKSVIANGITTISTDFSLMGKTMAELIVQRKKNHIENPCNLILRKSL
jgi:DNA-binding transcriptional regulator YhcF (GntR family)